MERDLPNPAPAHNMRPNLEGAACCERNFETAASLPMDMMRVWATDAGGDPKGLVSNRAEKGGFGG